jgi:hypothetical protein
MPSPSRFGLKRSDRAGRREWKRLNPGVFCCTATNATALVELAFARAGHRPKAQRNQSSAKDSTMFSLIALALRVFSGRVELDATGRPLL